MSVRVSHPVLGTLDTAFQPDFGMYKDREGWRIYGFWFPFDDGAPGSYEDIFVDHEEFAALPMYNPDVWASRKNWFEQLYADGYYWITDYYDENGELKR